jgi:hypothetical protein
MYGIYTYIPETNHVPKQYIVAAILSLLFMVPISLAAALALMYFYVRIIIIIIIIIVIMKRIWRKYGRIKVKGREGRRRK